MWWCISSRTPDCEVASRGTPDVCSALLSFGDVPVSLSASRKSSKKIRSIYIEEEDRTIEGDFMSQEVTIYRRPETYESANERYVQENVIEKVLVNRIEPLNRELQIFIECVREGRPFPISQWEATMNLEICERIAQCFSTVRGASSGSSSRRPEEGQSRVRLERPLVNAALNSPTFRRAIGLRSPIQRMPGEVDRIGDHARFFRHFLTPSDPLSDSG